MTPNSLYSKYLIFKKQLLLALSCGVILLTGCSPSDPGPQKSNSGSSAAIADTGVYILNQGNYGFTPGSIDFINPATGDVIHDLYKSINGYSAGNVVQSAVEFNDFIYLVVNESQEVQKLEVKSKKVTAKLEGLSSPRHFLGISSGKAYVSDLYSGSIHIIDPIEMKKTGSIAIGSWTEEMVLAGDKVYVLKKRRDLESADISVGLWVINTATDAIVDSLVLPLIPVGLVMDNTGKLHVAARNDQNKEAKIYTINPGDLSIEKTLEVPASGILADEYALRTLNGGEKLCLLSRHIYVWPANAASFPESPFINAGNRILFGLGTAPLNNEIWVSDALDYLQQGVIYRYSATGEQLAQYRAGIVPGYFLFKNW